MHFEIRPSFSQGCTVSNSATQKLEHLQKIGPYPTIRGDVVDATVPCQEQDLHSARLA